MSTKSLDPVGVTFVNLVMGSGTLNNVVNIQFGTYQFDADEERQKVEPNLAVSCRLRMDFACAQQLHANLTQLLGTIAAEQEELARMAVEGAPKETERPN